MILTHMIGINEMLKLTQGQGHKVKGQGRQRSRSNMQLCEKIVWAINQERMIVSSSTLYIVFIFMHLI